MSFITKLPDYTPGQPDTDTPDTRLPGLMCEFISSYVLPGRRAAYYVHRCAGEVYSENFSEVDTHWLPLQKGLVRWCNLCKLPF